MTQIQLFEEPRISQQMPLDFEAPRQTRRQEGYLQIHKELDYWEILKTIAERRNSGVKGIKRILRSLREEGYIIKSYSEMGKEEALNYLRKVRHDISSHLAVLHEEEFYMR